MYLQVTNTPQPYAWGSRTAIANLQGRPAADRPEAEVRLGSHPANPSRIETPGTPWNSLDEIDQLPFLLKLLAADAPLSLQVHPSLEQAKRGFDRKNLAGIGLDAPERNFKDAMHKPEMVVALSDCFDALCGFRPAEETARSLHGAGCDNPGLQALLSRIQSGDVAASVQWLVGHDPLARAAIQELVEAASDNDGTDWQTVRELALAYPRDAGVAIAFLMNRVSLRRGQALFLAPREVHAYLHGFGLELMAASDNVLRAGLTPKHVDVDMLLDTATFAPGPAPFLAPTPSSRVSKSSGLP